MPKACAHAKHLASVDVAGRPIKTCSDCGARLGTCANCNDLVALDADGYIDYHDFPKPCRVVCRGSKYSSVEDTEHAADQKNRQRSSRSRQKRKSPRQRPRT